MSTFAPHRRVWESDAGAKLLRLAFRKYARDPGLAWRVSVAGAGAVREAAARGAEAQKGEEGASPTTYFLDSFLERLQVRGPRRLAARGSAAAPWCCSCCCSCC